MQALSAVIDCSCCLYCCRCLCCKQEVVVSVADSCLLQQQTTMVSAVVEKDEAVLRELGYKQVLYRTWGTFTTVTIAISAMSVLTSISGAPGTAPSQRTPGAGRGIRPNAGFYSFSRALKQKHLIAASRKCNVTPPHRRCRFAVLQHLLGPV